jgi:hypothetical protein
MPEVIRPNLVTTQSRRGLVARVYDALKRPDVKVAQYRLRKALTTGADDATVRPLAAALTREQRDEVLTDIRKSQVSKGWWNAATRKFDAPFPTEQRNPGHKYSVTNPRPEQTSGSAKPGDESRKVPAGPAIFPTTQTSFLRALNVGDIVHFDLDGQRHHGRIVQWGKLGARVVTATGEVAAVRFEDMRHGVHPDAREEHEALKRDREMAELEKSLGDNVYAMSPLEREAFFAARDESL